MDIFEKWIKSQYTDLLQGKKVEIMLTKPTWYIEKFEKVNGIHPVIEQTRDNWFNVSLPKN